MSDYCRCKDNCTWCNPDEKDGYKVHCDYYGTYEDPDEIRECPHYKKD